MSTFQVYYDLDLKSKVVSGYDFITKLFLDLNPISHGGHLTLFWPPDFLDEYFPDLLWP